MKSTISLVSVMALELENKHPDFLIQYVIDYSVILCNMT